MSPLSGLTNLTHLFLDNNSITDVSPLSGFDQPDTFVFLITTVSRMCRRCRVWTNLIELDS